MNQLEIRTIGKVPESWMKEAVDMYVDRIKQFLKIAVIELPEGQKKSASPDISKTLKAEGVAILKGIQPGTELIILDEGGRQFDSPGLADFLKKRLDQGKSLTFVIGGSWGLAPEVKTAASEIISLGKMTLPHGLARVVLLEQLYRSLMINHGRTYHK